MIFCLPTHTHTHRIYFLNFVPVTLRNFSLQKPGWLVSNDILSNCVIRLSKSMHNARQRMHNQHIKTTKVDMAAPACVAWQQNGLLAGELIVRVRDGVQQCLLSTPGVSTFHQTHLQQHSLCWLARPRLHRQLALAAEY